MELKSYQRQVIKDLETFLNCLQQYETKEEAFNNFWSQQIGAYNPITGEGMQPYKNNLLEVPHVCIKVPTAGGKTFIACNALYSIFQKRSIDAPKTVVWLVPWSNLLDQTLTALRNHDHPYRQKLNSLFNNRVEVYEKKDLLQGLNFNPSTVAEQLSIIIMSFSSLRVKNVNKENRKVYQENSQLMPFVLENKTKTNLLEQHEESALINVIRSLRPLVVVDESHNAETELSVDMLKALDPSFVLDLTATPKENSNLISLVPAIELKKEHMVKLPVIVYNHSDKTEVIDSALHLQQRLELLALEEEKKGGKYIRPIVLFQAQSKGKADNTTFEKLKAELLKIGIPEERIKIKTAEKDELKNIDLSSRDCPVRYIITINALKEGWDCPFAYVLASLADRSSAVEVEQVLGRVLRQPYVMEHPSRLLNTSYVLTASSRFQETLQNIVEGLQASGFSQKDYRQKNAMPENEISSAEKESSVEDEIVQEKISFDINRNTLMLDNKTVLEIEAMAEQQNAKMKTLIEEQRNQRISENMYQEMGNKVKRYKLKEIHRDVTYLIKLPQFFISISPQNDLQKTDKVLLNQELMLKDFNLREQAAMVDHDHSGHDVYEIDLEQIEQNDHHLRYGKIEEEWRRSPVVNYILDRPREKQIKEIAYQLMKQVGNLPAVKDQDLREFIERTLVGKDTEKLKDIILRHTRYAVNLKAYIKLLMDNSAEKRFYELTKIRTIFSEPNWVFPEMILPGTPGPSITKSLYEQEASMNNFEAKVITEIAAMQNVVFWHRNFVKGNGFAINGYKSNHYPDFIVYTKSGKIIIIETKGDHYDNSDSAAKCRLGNTWAEKAGIDFYYFMIFDKKEIEDAYTLEKAKELIRQIQ
jgi:type III restriction enzyme